MTTVTIVTGNGKAGKMLIGAALAHYINHNGGKAYSVIATSNLSPKNFSNKLDDLILVSTSGEIESWMQPWIQKYGEPLFIINSTRTRT